MSHLLQMRGLKRLCRLSRERGKVASFTDAWIETLGRANLNTLPTSHLLQMRGLKQDNADAVDKIGYVASFTDAWIETYCP